MPLLRDSAGLRAGPVGAILAAGAVSTFAASLSAGALSRRFRPAALISACLVVTPLTIAALGVAGAFLPALAAALVYMLLEGLFSVLAISERQRRAPARLQARVGITGRMILVGSMAAGSALASALTHRVAIGDLYLWMGAATLAVGIAATPLLLRLET